MPAGPDPDPAAAAATVRLHIAPLTADTSKSLLPPSATNVSFHTLPTFPERPFAFATLPAPDAAALKRKYHNAVFRGVKMSVADARPERAVVPIANGGSGGDGGKKDTEKKKEKKEKRKKDKKKPDQGVLPGFQLPEGRKVKRGWDKNGECVVAVAVPPNRAALADEFTADGKKKKKKEKKRKAADELDATDAKTERVKRKKVAAVKEGENTTIFPQFLKENQLDSKRGKGDLATEFVEGTGWVDAKGKVVEEVKKKERVVPVMVDVVASKKEKKKAEPSPVGKKTTMRGVVSFSDAESDAEMEPPVKPAAVVYHSSSESEPEAPAHENESEDESDEDEDVEMASPPPAIGDAPKQKQASPVASDESSSSEEEEEEDSSDSDPEKEEDQETVSPPAPAASKTETTPSPETDSDADSDAESESSTSSSSSDDDDEEASSSEDETNPVDQPASKTDSTVAAPSSPTPSSSSSSSASSSSASSSSSSPSPSPVSSPSKPASSEPIKVHALEALYKPTTLTPSSPTTGDTSSKPFAFGFGGPSDSDSDSDSDGPVVPAAATPYKDPARYRSGAPTPDTAAVSRTRHIANVIAPAPFSLGVPGGSGSGGGKLLFPHRQSAFLRGSSQWTGVADWSSHLSAAAVDEEGKAGAEMGDVEMGDDAEIGKVEKWKKLFYDNRGEWNREWKRRRREAVKSRRKRERVGVAVAGGGGVGRK